MKLRKLNLTELLKVGLSSNDPNLSTDLGWASLINARTDGSVIRSCETETVLKVSSSVIPFTVGIDDYLLKPDGVYSSAGTLLYLKTFIGTPKVIDLIKFVMIQDDVSTIFVDAFGVYNLNPSGRTIPLAKSPKVMNGQLIFAGITDNYNNLGEDYVIWSGIGTDDFTVSKSNDAGLGHPNIGKIHSAYPLQDSLILLGSRGASQMFYAGHIFGFRDLDIPLAKSPNLGASSTNICVYIAKDGSIIKVDKSGSFENVGFSWIGKDVVDVKYLNGRNWFVFSTTSMSYILDPKGMFSFGYKIYGELTEDLVVPTDFSQTTSLIRTTFSDFGKVGNSQLHEVYLAKQGVLDYGSIKAYANNISISGGLRDMNNFGAAKYPIVGNTLSIEHQASGEFQISSFIIELFDIDKRFGIGSIPYTR